MNDGPILIERQLRRVAGVRPAAKDMLDLAKHIVNQTSGRFEPDGFEENRADRPDQPEARRQADDAEGAAARRDVVDLMEVYVPKTLSGFIE
jgi:non-homologous end joining protein Ku